MEQAGILNCVSVPDGAPQQVSAKALPSKKQVYMHDLFVYAYAVIFLFLFFLERQDSYTPTQRIFTFIPHGI